MKQCAERNGFNIATAQKHAKLNDIEFDTDPRAIKVLPPGSGMFREAYSDAERHRAADQLAREIAAAKREAATAPLYRRWPDGV